MYRLTFNCQQLNTGAASAKCTKNSVLGEDGMARKQGADFALRLDNQICFAIYSTAHAFNRIYKPLLVRLGLTYPQYLVMLVLWERDGVPVKDIGDRLFLDSCTLSPLLKRLEAAGHLKRPAITQGDRPVAVPLAAPARRGGVKRPNVPPA